MAIHITSLKHRGGVGGKTIELRRKRRRENNRIEEEEEEEQ